MNRPGLAEVQEAAGLLHGVARRTPLMRSGILSRRAGARVLLKAEHLQRTGSFKIRGAYVRIAKLEAGERRRGVVAASAGNHAQGVAWAGSRLEVATTIVMPAYASLPKVEATRSHGAEVILHGETFDDALAHAQALAAERGAVLVHAFDDPWVIAGQGTVGLEICAGVADPDRVVVPVGGGGLASGIGIAVRALAPRTRMIGVRPASMPNTIADGAAVKRPGELTKALLEEVLDDDVEVSEDAISEAMVLLLEGTKQVVEGAGALALAAVLSGLVPAGGTTVLVASGGNVDPELLSRVIRHGLTAAGRYLFLRVRLRDRPGELRGVLEVLAGLMVNVVSVVHHRIGLTLPIDQVEVELTLETRDRDHAREVVGHLRGAGYHVDD